MPYIYFVAIYKLFYKNVVHLLSYFHNMTNNQHFTSKWRHKLYKALFIIFVIFVVIAVIELQPTADVPAPTIYGFLLILLVDTLYYEWIVRLAT